MHNSRQIASNSIIYTLALAIQKILSTLYFWYYSNNLPGGAQDMGRFNFVLSFVTLFLIGYLCFFVLNRLPTFGSYGFGALAVLHFAFMIPLILAWAVSSLLCISFFVPTAAILSILIAWVVNAPSFLWFE